MGTTTVTRMTTATATGTHERNACGARRAHRRLRDAGRGGPAAIDVAGLAGAADRFRPCPSLTGAPVAACLHSFAFGQAENMVQAPVKATPLGQSAGQRIPAEWVQAIPQAATEALAIDDDRRQAFAPMFAMLSTRHETPYSRLFRS
jgi:hypothetical protein